MLSDKNYQELKDFLRAFRHGWDGQVYLTEDEADQIARKIAFITSDELWEQKPFDVRLI